jgi:CDP-glycerol glycerophosphotransferase
MTVPRISVIVPFFNVGGELLDDCLSSIAAQTVTDLQVIVVDDGSTDASAEVAAARAAADPRFTLLRVPNGGPGHARNRGLELATGTYLAFVDGDDVLPPHAYERLLHALEASGSDFVSGNVQRIGPLGITQSALHAKAIKGRRTRTHISATPALFYDVSVWNKLFRRSFWTEHGLTYPEGMVWEDIQVMTRAHVLASAVDVIPDSIYYWRERGTGALSITQSRTDISNYTDRITALLAIDAFLRGRRPARLVRQHQRKALVNDIWLYVGELGRTTDSFREEFMRLTQRYLAQVDRRVFGKLPSVHRLAYHLIAAGRPAELLELVMWTAEQPVRTVPVVRERGRLQADLPFRGDPELNLPARLYRPHWRELDPFVRVESVEWEDGKLVIAGCAFVPSVDITQRRHTSKLVLLVPGSGSRRRLPIVVPARSTQHPYATGWSRQDRYSYDWAGFRAAISPRWFQAGGKWLTGDWDAYVLVRGRGIWRPARLHTPVVGPAERPVPRQVAPGVRLGARWVGRQLHVQVTATPALLAGCRRADGELVLEVDVESPGAAEPGTDLALAWSAGSSQWPLGARAERLPGGAVRLRAAVPDAVLLREVAGAAPGVGAPAGAVEWDLYLTRPGEPRIRVAFAPDVPEFTYQTGNREMVVARTRYGNAAIVRRTEVPVIDQHGWSSDGRLTMSGTYAATAGQRDVLLRRKGSTDQHVLPLERDGQRFSVTIDATAMPSFGQQLPLRDGTWEILVRQPAAAGGAAEGAGAGEGDGEREPELIAPAYDHARLAEVGDRRLTFGPKAYRFTTSGYDAPILTVGPAFKITEGGRVQRKVLRSVYYPVQQRRPLRDAVVFISWKGKQCGDNPQAIAEELRRRGDTREHIWAVTDWSVPVPPGGTAVLAGTESYYEALARSRYLIANDDMQAWHVKRAGQVYVQTWHGTPLKRIGFDISQPQFVSGTRYLEHLKQEVAKWDLLLSPNPFSTPIMRRAFRYDGEICESGYPRNDVLCSGDAGRIAAQARERLGIPAGKRVILYAPTWRDDQYYASGRYRFDFRLDLEQAWRQLGPDTVILLRGHHHMADDVPPGTRPGFVLNVTGYPSMAELCLVSDALITDYSSVMFDFAPTGKPMLFFTYDLETYRDRLRGFYFDFEAEAPGPLLGTSAEVVAALGDLDAVTARYAGAYQAFTTRFCPLDDGKAAARACDAIFGS